MAVKLEYGVLSVRQNDQTSLLFGHEFRRVLWTNVLPFILTFRNLASYIKDGRKITL